jgi:hypothetical protein
LSESYLLDKSSIALFKLLKFSAALSAASAAPSAASCAAFSFPSGLFAYMSLTTLTITTPKATTAATIKEIHPKAAAMEIWANFATVPISEIIAGKAYNALPISIIP